MALTSGASYYSWMVLKGRKHGRSGRCRVSLTCESMVDGTAGDYAIYKKPGAAASLVAQDGPPSTARIPSTSSATSALTPVAISNTDLGFVFQQHGICGAGLLPGSCASAGSLAGCRKHCSEASSCGFFSHAPSPGKGRGELNHNCCLYTRAGGCQSNGQYSEEWSSYLLQDRRSGTWISASSMAETRTTGPCSIMVREICKGQKCNQCKTRRRNQGNPCPWYADMTCCASKYQPVFCE